MSVSAIEWTREVEIVDRGGRRTRIYQRTTTNGPGARERRTMAQLGFKWCRRCRLWLCSDLVVRGGLCLDHVRADYRERYATDGGRIRRQKVARKRRVEPLPEIAIEILTEAFGGRCAYCPASATTWDHIVPVASGGRTIPGNIVPACRSCNSSKCDHRLDPWLATTGRVDVAEALADVLILAELA